MNRKGAALITVLVAVTIVSIMLFEFQYQCMVEQRLSYNELNQLQAYYLAKSGARIGLLRLNIYGRAKRSPDIKKALNNLPLDSYLDSIWNLPLPAFPPSAASVAKMLKSDKDAAQKAISETKIAEGQFTEVITSESAKINLNFLSQIPPNMQGQRIVFNTRQPQGLFQYIGVALINLMENFLKESEDPVGEYGNLKPEEVVGDIMDWILPGSERINGGNKDAYYEQQNPPYKAKKYRFYSTEELKLVKGIDDHLYEKLKPYVTVYSQDGMININSMSNGMLKAIYPDFTDDDIKRINEERERLGGWPAVQTFMDFIQTSMGKGGFASLYSNKQDLPFTVSSQSFLIESQGRIEKSKSAIQKTIRVAVAFAKPQAGTPDSTYNNATACNAAPWRVWYAQLGTCIVKPSNQEECTNALPGATWSAPGQGQCGQYGGCVPPGQGASSPLCITATDQTMPNEASALKILHWTEL